MYLQNQHLRRFLGDNAYHLETVVEIKAALNDKPLTFISSGQGDLEPLMPVHLLQITCLPHEAVDESELTDPTYSKVCGNVKLLATILQISSNFGIMNI